MTATSKNTISEHNMITVSALLTGLRRRPEEEYSQRSLDDVRERESLRYERKEKLINDLRKSESEETRRRMI
uniref:IBB domain-containing protein n=1 Tax=Ascaris lumbricoides TaxID=6252 RepID=A0A0M3HZE2_ASCLU